MQISDMTHSQYAYFIWEFNQMFGSEIMINKYIRVQHRAFGKRVTIYDSDADHRDALHTVIYEKDEPAVVDLIRKHRDIIRVKEERKEEIMKQIVSQYGMKMIISEQLRPHLGFSFRDHSKFDYGYYVVDFENEEAKSMFILTYL